MARAGRKSKAELRKEDKDKFLPAVIFKEQDEPLPYHEHPYEAKLWARYAWFSEKYSQGEIADLIEVNPKTVGVWVRGTQKVKGWAKEKEEIESRQAQKAVRQHAERMDKLLIDMLDMLEISVAEFFEQRHKLSVSEFRSFLDGFEKLYRTRQLEMGRPTDILQGLDAKSLTWNQIRGELEDVDILDYGLLKPKVKVRADGSTE